MDALEVSKSGQTYRTGTQTALAPVVRSYYFFYLYSRSRKTVNTRENFWNVYCFATNEKRDETAKDNRQTAA